MLRFLASPQSFSRTLIRKWGARLNYVVFGSAFVSIILAEVLWLVPAMFTQEKKLLNELTNDARLAVAAVVETARFEDVALTNKIGRRLMEISEIKGGMIYDFEGNRIGNFGQTPTLSWMAIAKDGRLKYRDPSRCCLDIFLSPLDSGLPYNIVLRLDATSLNHALWSHLTQLASSVLLIAVVTCIGVVSQLYFWVVHPIMALKEKIKEGRRKSIGLSIDTLNWRRGDEIGDLARGIDSLFTNITQSFEEDTRTADAIMRATPLSILQYDKNAALVDANHAALDLFGEENLSGLRTLDRNLVEPEDAPTKEGLAHILEWLGEGGKIQPCKAVTKSGDVPCLVTSLALRNRDETVRRYVVTLVPITNLAAEISRLNARVSEKERKFTGQKLKTAEMSLILAANTSFMKTLKPKAEPQEPEIVTNCEAIMARWATQAKDLGLDLDVLVEGQMPNVIGDEQVVTAAFRQALVIVYLRTLFAKPYLSVRTEQQLTGERHFIIADISTRYDRDYLPDGITHMDPEESLIALQTLIKQAGGEMLYTNSRPGAPNEIAFSLPLAKEQPAKRSKRTKKKAKARAPMELETSAKKAMG